MHPTAVPEPEGTSEPICGEDWGNTASPHTAAPSRPNAHSPSCSCHASTCPEPTQPLPLGTALETSSATFAFASQLFSASSSSVFMAEPQAQAILFLLCWPISHGSPGQLPRRQAASAPGAMARSERLPSPPAHGSEPHTAATHGPRDSHPAFSKWSS